MRISLLLAAVVAATLFVKPARAAITINMQETGGDVVFFYSGSLDITGLAPAFTNTSTDSFIEPGIRAWVVFGGPARPPLDQYSNALTGPREYGTGGNIDPDADSTGDVFGFSGDFNVLRLPANYISGTRLSGMMTFGSTDFNTLGIDTASAPYVWSIVGTGDTITLQVIPEPTSALFLGCTGAMACLRRRRR